MRQAAQASPHPSVPVVDVGEQGCEQGKTKEDDDYKSSQSGGGGGGEQKTKQNQTKNPQWLCASSDLCPWFPHLLEGP